MVVVMMTMMTLTASISQPSHRLPYPRALRSAQVYAFMLAEMGTTGSIDASSRMVIKGRFPPKAIEQIVRRSVCETLAR